MSEIIDVLEEQLVRGRQISVLSRKRKLEYFEKSVKHVLVPECIDEGWEVFRKLKFKTKLRKTKPIDRFFEDRVWRLFAEMGFHSLNRDRNFNLPYTKDGLSTQQIDVFAADDEIAVIVECKASNSGPRKGNFKKEIEALTGEREGLIASTRKLLGKKDIKVVLVFATFNYFLSKPDQERLESFNIFHFDNETVSYYEELLKHLGTASRFQLEANLFPGLKIPALDSRVPAIRGKMGGHTYFSFMMEPGKLLKVGYILHRSKANKKLMPTYQRLIKKTRLSKIRKFIEAGGFFPNSIIVNIDSNRAPRFDLADKQLENTPSRIGILHLPQKYRSIFVIDGQHRLYGYSGTEYSENNAVPVVAFVNLDRSEQVRIFMEINENQKAVPKNLRHTLNADLQWDSENLLERNNALKLQIAQDLGEDLASPLYDRVIVGENVRTEKRSITLDALKQGLDRGNFFGEFTKVAVKREGLFYKGTSDKTYEAVFPFLMEMFRYLEIICEQEWNRPARDGGLILSNLGVNAILRLFSDVVQHLDGKKAIDPKYQATEELVDRCTAYLDPLAHFFRDLDEETREQIRKAYGSGGPIRFWRILQREVAAVRKKFKPQGLEQYWVDESKAFNTQSFEMIRDIEEFLNRDFRERLRKHHGSNWFKVGVPVPVYEDSTAMASKKNKEIFKKKDEKTPWDCLHIIDYRKIALYPGNWKDIFEAAYTRPGDEKISGGGKAKTDWMDKLNRIRNATDHDYSVKQDEFEFLQEIHGWLIEG